MTKKVVGYRLWIVIDSDWFVDWYRLLSIVIGNYYYVVFQGTTFLLVDLLLVKVLENSKKLWPAARVPSAFLVLPNFQSCFYNSIESRYICFLFLKYLFYTLTKPSLKSPGGDGQFFFESITIDIPIVINKEIFLWVIDCYWFPIAIDSNLRLISIESFDFRYRFLSIDYVQA